MLLVPSPALCQRASVTDTAVDQAIQRGVDYLLGLAPSDGRFSPDGKSMRVNYAYPFDHEAIIMCALAHAEVSLNDERIGKAEASLHGLYLGDRLVGVCSDFDMLLSLTGVKAYDRRGYGAADARAVATTMLLPATLQGKEPPASATSWSVGVDVGG